MKKKYLLSLVLMFLCFSGFSTHIVGGEIEVTHLEGDLYTLKALVYFDEVNGNPGAKDNDVFISVFGLSTDELYQTFNLPIVEESDIEYSDPECASASLQTSRIVYAADILLDPEVFDDPEGLYFTWERCCRNNSIKNIVEPESAAQVFYLEFPPLLKDGEPFINSSPRLFPPLSDFACVGLPFFTDFRGSDLDGDSLVYSLATPWTGTNATAIDPRPIVMFPAPYEEVEWAPPSSDEDQVPGSPSLEIDVEGFLRVTPEEAGLYVFAVLCEEYRDGERIGSVRRDFQILVLNCPDFTPPFVDDVTFSETSPINPGQGYNQTDTIVFEEGEGNNPCLEIEVGDNDIGDVISATLDPINFSVEGVGISPDSSIVGDSGEPLVFSICMPSCPANKQGDPYLFDIIFEDNSCAVPLTDTVNFAVQVVPLPNDPPEEEFGIPFDNTVERYFAEVQMGSSLSFEFTLRDLDGDIIEWTAEIESEISAILEGLGSFELQETSNAPGELTVLVTLDAANCEVFPAGESELLLPFEIHYNDVKECAVMSYEKTAEVLLRVYIVPELPEVTSSVSPLEVDPETGELFASVDVGESLILDFSAISEDSDVNIALSAIPDGFEFESLGMEFEPAVGVGEVSAPFRWEPECEALLGTDQQVYSVSFVTNSSDPCNTISDTESITVQLRVNYIPQLNELPLATTDQSGEEGEDISLGLRLGESISFEVSGRDGEDTPSQSLLLYAEGRGFNLEDYGMVFETVQGVGEVSQTFFFNPPCNAEGLPNPGLPEETLLVDFFLRDSADCYTFDTDIVTASIQLIRTELPNSIPSIAVDQGSFDEATSTYLVDVVIGDELLVGIEARDEDEGEVLTLSISNETAELSTLGVELGNIQGTSPLFSSLAWTPTCDLLGEGSADREYAFQILVTDSEKLCGVQDSEEVNLIVNLKDRETEDFIPANVFSPNGDGIGDEFYLDNLPLDNCKEQFLYIQIFNRWGNIIYESKDRDFRWTATGLSSGAYQYIVRFSNSAYKGIVHVVD